MIHSVLFKSAAPERLASDLVRALTSLRVAVVALETLDRDGLREFDDTPLVTISRHPSELGGLPLPRLWINFLPEDRGSPQPFLEVGASAVLRWPVERAKLLSVVAQHLAGAGIGEVAPDD